MSEAIAAALVVPPAAIIVCAYLIDRLGGSFPPGLMLGVGVLAAATMAARVRAIAQVRGVRQELPDMFAFLAILGGTFGWLLWIARPSFLPKGSGSDLTHHLLLIRYIEEHWRLVHGPGVEDYLGEMVYYTPGSHILVSLAGAWSQSSGLRALHPVMSAAVALKAGFVYLVAKRLLPRHVPGVPIASLAAIALFASQTYFLGSFMDFSFVAQVVAELFAVAMWWLLTAWDQQPRVTTMALVGGVGAALFLTWPVLIGPPLMLLACLVLLPRDVPLPTRLGHATVALMPIVVVAALFIVGRTGMMLIAGTGGRAVWPTVAAYGWPFVALSSAGVVAALVTIRPAPGVRAGHASASLVFFTLAILFQAAVLYWFARAHSNEPYMALKMFYLLLCPQAVAVAVAIGEGWRLAIGTSIPNLAWILAAVAALVVARPLASTESLLVGRRPAASLDLERAGEWARAHVPIKCVEYLVGDDETAYWLHLAVLGNARQGPRTADNATYELTPTLVRWLTPGGLPYAIADLPVLPTGVRDELDIVQQFGTAAVVRRREPSSCDEP